MPEPASHSGTVPSSDAEVSNLPFCEKTTALTLLKCLSSVYSATLISYSQMAISSAANASSLPFGKKTTDLMLLAWLWRTLSTVPELAS